jgi:uncharacterized damage-inducible protein DinB
MTARIQRLLDGIERHRHEVLADAGRVTGEQLTWRPGVGVWSVLDVVEHLVRVEEGIVSRVKKREPRTMGETVRTRLALVLVWLTFRTGRRIKVPVEAIAPVGGVTLADLEGRWAAAQAGMRRTMEALQRQDYARPLMRHPLIGLLTPAETLSFIGRHIRHHRGQIARIRRAPGFPA